MFLGMLTFHSITASATITIKTCADLQNMQKNLTADYVLSNDIDCSISRTWNSGQGFLPIGAFTLDGSKDFKGTFNGQGHTISDLYINNNTATIEALFASTSIGSINNVNLKNFYFASDIGASMGGLVGIANNSGSGTFTISNVSVQGVFISLPNPKGTLTFEEDIGGIAQTQKIGSTITQSSSDVTIICLDNTNYVVGGIISSNDGNVVNSYSTGQIAGAFHYAGGRRI